MQHLNQINILKNQVQTVEQFKILAYLKTQFNLNEVQLYLVNRNTIKLVDIVNKVGYFRFNYDTKNIDFYEKKKELER